MGIIRVRVQVLLWTDPIDSVKARREIQPFLEPCDEEVTINELALRIENRFNGVHTGKG